ncbi:sulfite exporter TauE/SafE family protein [Aliiroseovarius subalbicans]|uniref:sulfite exporter TauE/SafE family protein n=1 Tax=Aliiroseovarius subalbicans TaxID=2925840 RepID=UPI001F5AADA7|nr:sulfite exporter TauE/SafE family protein [Aliiroseovarius subalbicans]MCI2398875.1 sulfite exporter TauE/SafE family protein [Aliiroseovarius subalbicans]
MPDLIAAALGQEYLLWLVAATTVAGVVRGFTGFGTAMIYMPVAGQILDPFAALVTLTAMDVIGPLPNVPRAVRDGHRRDILRLCGGLLIAMPIGIWTLASIAPEVFRYSVSLLSLTLLVLLITGYRYRGTLKHWMIYATGMLGGFLAGATGLAGPPVIMLYMASRHQVRVIRANLLLYLLGVDLLMMLLLWVMGRLEPTALVLGFLLALPYLAGNVLGGWLFRPELEKTYRAAAYLLIAASALSGLPLFD